MSNPTIFLSASCPSPELAQSFTSRLGALLSYLDASGYNLVYGCHPSVSPLVASQFSSERTTAHALRKFADSVTVPEGTTLVIHEGETIHDQLKAMRLAMVKSADRAIFMGGKHAGLGGKPGVVDEWELFVECGPDHAASRLLVVDFPGAAESGVPGPRI